MARLCRRLDCLPLAIELAAARTRDYAPPSCSSSVPGSLELAGEGARDLPSRQRTLRATIDWSYRLLAPEEQATVRAPRRVRRRVRAARAPPPSAAPAARRWRRSSRASLSTSASTPAARRGAFMLETVREYALELLEGRGEGETSPAATPSTTPTSRRPSRTSTRRVDRGAAWRAARGRAGQLPGRARLEPRAGAVELQLRLVGALAYFWATSDHLREGRARDRRRRCGRRPTPRRRCGRRRWPARRSWRTASATTSACAASAEASLELFRPLGDERRTALALNQLGIALSNLGDIEGGIVCHEENAEISRRLGDGIRLSAALNNLGYCLLRRGRHDRARTLFEEGLAVCRKIGHRTAESVMLGNLGLPRCSSAVRPRRSGSSALALLIDRELGLCRKA